jgi:hypothetical protein
LTYSIVVLERRGYCGRQLLCYSDDGKEFERMCQAIEETWPSRVQRPQRPQQPKAEGPARSDHDTPQEARPKELRDRLERAFPDLRIEGGERAGDLIPNLKVILHLAVTYSICLPRRAVLRQSPVAALHRRRPGVRADVPGHRRDLALQAREAQGGGGRP